MTADRNSPAPRVSTNRTNSLAMRQLWTGGSDEHALGATVSGNVRGSVGEDAEEVAEILDECLAASRRDLHRLDERRDNALERLAGSASSQDGSRTYPLDNSETVGVVALQHVCAHEGEDRHHVVHELVGHERAQLRKEQQGLVRRLGIRRGCDLLVLLHRATGTHLA